MEAQERGGFQADGGTDQPARAYEQRTHAGDHPISQTEVWGTSPGAIENQQLLLDEYGLGHYGTRPTRTGEPGDSRQEVDNEDSQVAHRTIVTSERNPGNAKKLGIRHAHVTAHGSGSSKRRCTVDGFAFGSFESRIVPSL